MESFDLLRLKAERHSREGGPPPTFEDRCSAVFQGGVGRLALADAVAGHAIACDFFTEGGKGVDAFLGTRAPRWPE